MSFKNGSVVFTYQTEKLRFAVDAAGAQHSVRIWTVLQDWVRAMRAEWRADTEQARLAMAEQVTAANTLEEAQLAVSVYLKRVGKPEAISAANEENQASHR